MSIKKTLCCFLLVVLLSIGSSASAKKKEVIKFSDQQWQTHWINNAIAMFIVEHGYGYPTETVVTTTPVMKQVFPKGDIDVNTELWRFNWLDLYNELVEDGKIIDLGPTFEKSIQAWYVPRYMIEGDPERGIEATAPDLKSVSDLPKYKDLFQDPEDPDKGLFISCVTGWQCSELNRAKFFAYGLDEFFNIVEPGTSPALDAAIAGAYKKGNPILAYYWEPTWLMGAYDMYQLKEPEYTEACEKALYAAIAEDADPEKAPKEAGCAYREYAIHKAIHPSLQERAPEVVEFLKNMNIGTATLNDVAAYMEQENVEADEAALFFFKTYAERWRSWLPDDIAAKVEQALADEGVTF